MCLLLTDNASSFGKYHKTIRFINTPLQIANISKPRAPEKKTAMYTPQKFRNYENRMSLPAKHIVAQRLGEKIKDRSLWPTASWEYEGLGKKSQPTSTDRKCFVCRNS